jgi:hypothetical protein
MLESFLNFVERFLNFGHLDKGCFTSSKFTKKYKAFIKSTDSKFSFSNPSGVLGTVSFSFSSSGVHGGIGIND